MADMTRAGRWIRVSSGGQDEANQEPDIDRHCASVGLNVVKTYTLHDRSASKGEQQSMLDEVIRDMQSNEISTLVCWHSDRLERRGVLETLMFIAQVKSAGGRVVSTQEGVLDETNLNTVIGAYMNHQKTDHLAKQVAQGHNHARANGGVLGPVPWGMTLEGPKYNRKMTGTEEGRTWIPQIFNRVIKGDSLRTICIWLTSEGVTLPPYGDKAKVKKDTPRAWHESTLGGMIRNPCYMGFRCTQDKKTQAYGEIVSKGEALVDPSVWRSAQEALDKRPKRGYSNPETRAMLVGVLKCGNPDCNASGAPDSPMNRTHSSTRDYYRCCGTGACRRSCGMMVPLELVDNAVDKIIAESFAIHRKIRQIIPGTDHSADLESIAFELKQLPSKELPEEEEDAERSRLRAERNRIKALPVVEDREVFVDAPDTYADTYNALRASERGPWLSGQGFTVRASKEAVTVSQASSGKSVRMTL